LRGMEEIPQSTVHRSGNTGVILKRRETHEICNTLISHGFNLSLGRIETRKACARHNAQLGRFPD
jgi:hypothetical protein